MSYREVFFKTRHDYTSILALVGEFFTYSDFLKWKLKPVISIYGLGFFLVFFCFSCSKKFLALKHLSCNIQKNLSCKVYF